MKQLLLSILLLLTTVFSFGQGKATADKEAAKQLIRDSFEEVWSNLDTGKIKKYHTDDFIILEDGLVWNNDSIANYQAKALPRMEGIKRNNAFEFIKVEKRGDAIWLAYHNWATWTKEGKEVGKARWLESAVAVKTAAGWKLQMLHSTRVEEGKE